MERKRRAPFFADIPDREKREPIAFELEREAREQHFLREGGQVSRGGRPVSSCAHTLHSGEQRPAEGVGNCREIVIGAGDGVLVYSEASRYVSVGGQVPKIIVGLSETYPEIELDPLLAARASLRGAPPSPRFPTAEQCVPHNMPDLEITMDDPEYTMDDPEYVMDDPEFTMDDPEYTMDDPEYTMDGH
ncbi:hypothetical protein BC827DRAFT_1159374 [Russula dissimulans]|nr:hypothetical protein BC827DRAFT_1159374 [Russula dissimulans]